jgi:hypothetical protein
MCRRSRRNLRPRRRTLVGVRTYWHALLYAVVMGVGIYIGIAAARHATVVTAIPYALTAAVAIALAGCARVAYRKDQP